MSVVLYRSWTVFRRRGAAWMGLALLVGVVGGVCMAFGQGARHTQVVYRDFVEAEHAADVVMTGRSGFGFVGSVDLDQVERVPAVAQTARAFVGLPFSGKTDTGRPIGVSDLFPVASMDNRLGSTVERWKMLSGRTANPARVDEAVASHELARRMHLRVGSTLDLRFYDASRFVTVAAEFLREWPVQLHDGGTVTGGNARDPADGPSVHLHIVGIEASPLEIPPLLNDLAPVLHLTPAFAHKYAATIVGSPLSYIRLRQSSDLRSFQLDVERLAKGQPVSFISTLENQRSKVERSLRIEALILAIVTALLALAGGVAAAQTMSRQAASEARDDDLLRALGMERAQIRGVALVRSAVIGAVGAIVALLVAWLASSFTLLSNARLAALHTGPQLDPTTAIIGAASVLLFAMAVGALVAVRPRPAGRTKPAAMGGAAGEAVQRSGAPMSMALGIRFALRGQGRSASLLTMLLSAALGVATITMAATFTSLLHRSLGEPHRYGWNWDFKLGAPGLPDLAGPLVPALRADPRIRDLSVGSVTQIEVGPERVDVFAFDALRGDALPTLVAGHAPERPDEIVFGRRTAHDTGTALGREVRARIGARTATFKLVGTAVFPEFGDSGQLGTGAWTTVAGLRRITRDPPLRNTFLVGLTPAARAAGDEAEIVRAVAPLPARDSARPEDLVNLSRGDGLMVALVVLLALLALAVLLHALLISVRRDRSDHAVLRALGRTAGQTRLSVVWQSLTLASAAFVVGVPLGLAAARVLWNAYARNIGIEADTFVPFSLLALVFAGTLAVALIAAIVPAWIAGRRNLVGALHHDE